jgi:hypothetical protein
MVKENKTLTLCFLVMSAAILIGAIAAGPALALPSAFTVNRTTNESDSSTADGV